MQVILLGMAVDARNFGRFAVVIATQRSNIGVM